METEHPSQTITVEIITPEKTVFSGMVSMAVLPGTEGDFGVLGRHAPFASTLRAGAIKLFIDGKPSHLFTIGGGFADITPQRCAILAHAVIDMPH